MSIFVQLAQVRAAQARMTRARQQLGRPAAALLDRGRRHPLTTVGAAAGVGVVLGSLDVHPLRVPGVAPLLGGSLAEAVAIGTRLIVELGSSGLSQRAERSDGAEQDAHAGVDAA